MTVLFVFAVGLFAYSFSCDTDVGTLLTVTIHCLLSPYITYCHRTLLTVTAHCLLSPHIAYCHRTLLTVTVHCFSAL